MSGPWFEIVLGIYLLLFKLLLDLITENVADALLLFLMVDLDDFHQRSGA
jgi:hypothetical protein